METRSLRASADTRSRNSGVTFKLSWQFLRVWVEILCRSIRARGRVSRVRRPFKLAEGRRLKWAKSSMSSPSKSPLMSPPLCGFGKQSPEALPERLDFIARLAVDLDLRAA